jgi:hypothetical protein
VALYEKLNRVNIIRRAKPLLDSKAYTISIETGKITPNAVMGYNSPWVHVKHCGDMNCHLWHKVMFDYFKEDLGAPPINCQNCYKVVARPQDITQLLELEQYQESVKDKVIGCKCGIEVRDYVHGLYGGYFYNMGLEQGKETHRMVSAALAMPVFLKRGCTEYEVTYGNAMFWAPRDGQQEIEDYIESCFDISPKEKEQPEFVKDHIRMTWIEYACKSGDSEYIQHVDTPLHANYQRFDA